MRAKSSHSCRARPVRCGISRTSATGGPVRIPPASHRWLRFRPPPAPGSEVGRAAVILNEETHQKKIIFHPQMMPRIVISDPELTVGLPRAVTAATGMDAFVHCFEAFCAPGIPSAGRRRCPRGHAAHPPLPAARLCGRQGHRGARADVGRRIDGRHRLSEGPRRRACHRASRSARGSTPITA